MCNSTNTIPNTADLSPTKAAEAALKAKYDAGGNPLTDTDQKPIIAPDFVREMRSKCFSALAEWLTDNAPAHVRGLLCGVGGLGFYVAEFDKEGAVSADNNASILDTVADAANALAAAGAL